MTRLWWSVGIASVLLLFAGQARAMPADPADIGRHAIRVFTDQDGLPQNGITAIAFDRKRYLWVGTKDGAAVYNGRTWQTVNLPSEMRSNWVQAILVDSTGAAWFGTLGGGVARFDGASWTVWDTRSGLGNDEVTCLLEATAPGGRLAVFAGTADGVFRFDGAGWTALPSLGAVPQSGVRCMLERVGETGERELWVGTGTAGAARLRGNTWTRFTTADSTIPDDRIGAMIETAALDGRRVLLVGTYGSGIARWDGTSFVPYTGERRFDYSFVSCFLETRNADGSPALWVGGFRGLARFSGGRWTYFGPKSGLPNIGVWSLLDSPSPNGARTIWIGTAGNGLARWEQGRWVSFGESHGLPNGSVYSVMALDGPDGSSELWVGTNTGGLARLAGDRWTAMSLSNGWLADTVISILPVTPRPGPPDLLVGSYSNGLVVRQSGTWRQYGLKEGLPSLHVLSTSPTLDDPGAAWIGTAKGLVRYERGRLVPVAIPLPDPRVRTVLEIPSANGKTLWIGTERGLLRYETDSSTVFDSARGLPNDVVLCIVEVALPGGVRELWAGTRGGGVARLSMSAPESEWRVLSTSTVPALPNDTVYQIRQDAKGRIYLFTNKGIARLAPHVDAAGGFTTYVFTTEDGLPSNECNTGASYVDSRGRIWAGTIAGVAMLDPSTEIEDVAPKQLQVERAAFAGGSRPLLPDSVLRHDENHLLFEYALLSYFHEEDTLYRTQLVGLDPHPSAWTHDFKKEYTSLPHGDYVFRVWGMDGAGNVSGPVDIPFRIRPSPWFSVWAIAIYAVLVAGLVYLAVRYRVRTLRRRTLLLEERIEERTAELARKVEALRESEQRAQGARDGALESERRARESERHALEASRAKSVFLANMSHELRTPLNAIIGFVQLMERDRALSRAQRDNLSIIMRSGEHLLALINDVLSLSKIEAGRESVDAVSFDLHRLLLGLEEMFRLRAESKGLALVSTVDASVPRFVLGDEGKLRQVLINLLGNAVKFTITGTVTLRAAWRNGRATFEVEDTGPGLRPDEMQAIFKAFVQTKRGLYAQEGTGLGLAISRDYALMMGGDIAVESEAGRGATFRVTIELPEAEPVEIEEERRRVVGLEAGQRAWKILVVDDIPENRLLLTKLLEAVGFAVSEAANGREAIDVWRREAPDLVLMDVRMPVMDGISATRAIRMSEGAEGARERTRIIALTASAFEHDRVAILDAGCDDYVPKPFHEAVVFDKIASHLGARFVYEEPAAMVAAAAAVTVAPAGAALTAERISGVPSEARASLRDAVTIGDTTAALVAIAAIGERDEALALDLKGLVRAYRFDELLELLDQ
jgi:signal transduction histidine kinase/CheY-like chemotaxis protein/ligand-binding sensor domain-containing protein